MQAFNAQLAKGFQGNTKVVVVDFYTSLNDQVAHPEQFGLTNARMRRAPSPVWAATACLRHTFATCMATALSAMPAPGK